MKTPRIVSKNIKAVLDVLKDEVRGDWKAALKKLTPDYTMTWVEMRGKRFFLRTKKNIKKELQDVYYIKEREYDIKNIAEGKDVVMVELVESYPDPKTKKMYRTPLVLVLEMKNGKIRRGRHYCDTDLSYMFLSKKQVDRGFE